MEINWFTVIAQIVNFLILVWLLKRFLYKTVLNAIDEREKKIASQLSDAARNKAEAKKEQEDFRQKNEDFDKERTLKMNNAREEVDFEKQRLFEEVRAESAAMRSKYAALLKQQEQDASETVKRKTKDAVFEIAGKTLADLANADLEEQVVQVFIKKIKALDDEHIAKLKTALIDSHRPISVKSAFELSASSKQELEKVIATISGQHVDFEYLKDQALVSGIEINAGSYQLSWHIASYLEALKKDSITKEKRNAAN